MSRVANTNRNQATPHPLAPGAVVESAVPTLRVMRLQSPELHSQVSATWNSTSSSSTVSTLQTALCLPDSLVVYVGECFTAYLGVLNTSQTACIRRLTVSAQLQTPSQRHALPLPAHLEQVMNPTSTSGNNANGIDVVAPESGIDAIVSRTIEEAGQHILRIEVGYLLPETGAPQTFRKFYRFAVVQPLNIAATSIERISDTKCFVAISVTYPKLEDKQDLLLIASATIDAATGFTATNVDDEASSTESPLSTDISSMNAVQLWDASSSSSSLTAGACVSLLPGASQTYLFAVQAATREAQLRGIAAGDNLGRARIVWRKAMGETGTVYSPQITCPPSVLSSAVGLATQSISQNALSPIAAVHRSGWTVDIAAASAAATTSSDSNPPLFKSPSPHRPIPFNQTSQSQLQQTQLAVTVEPIDPPSTMTYNEPTTVQFLIVNHSEPTLTLQLLFDANKMDPGLVVTGATGQTLDAATRGIPGHGGSVVVSATFLPLRCGLLHATGCAIVDLASGRHVPQPPLFSTIVQAAMSVPAAAAPDSIATSSNMEGIAASGGGGGA